MARTGAKPVFGAGSIGQVFNDDATIRLIYDYLIQGSCNAIDTAFIYNGSEKLLGRTAAGERFTIDSKTPGGLWPGLSTFDGICSHIRSSLKETGVTKLDVYYIHGPDDTIPLDDMLAAIDIAFRAGHFQRFGLSNFSAEEVEKVYDICKSKGFIIPTVYQGNYNAFARRQETDIFPLLRKLGIAFYAYSPIAGGFLAKTRDVIAHGGDGAGRFGQPGHILGQIYNSMYNKPSYLKGLEDWATIAKDLGISGSELAYRWVIFDSELDGSLGDAVVFGAGKVDQIKETLQWFKKGSVGTRAREAINKIWKNLEKDAPLHNVLP